MTPGHSFQGEGGGKSGLTAEPEAGGKRGQGLRERAPVARLRAPRGRLQAGSRGVAALERAGGGRGVAQEDLGPQAPWRRASAAPASPGTRWAGSSRCSCTGYRSRPPPRRHSWRGRAPRTCPAGERPCSDPPAAQNASPRDWDPGRGVRPRWLCSGTAPEPGRGAGGRPHLLVQLVAGAQRLFHRGAVVRRVQIEEVDPGALQPLERRLQLGPEAVSLQRLPLPGIGLGGNFRFGGRM